MTPSVCPPNRAGRRREAVPIPPFHPNACVPVPAPTDPSATGPSTALRIAAQNVLARDVQAADVVQAAVVRLADERVHAAHVRVGLLRERPRHDRLERRSDAQRVGQDDRRLDRAELVDLSRAGELAERIADEHRSRDLVSKQIAGVRKDRRHTGAYAIAADDGRVTHAHAADVRDCVERTGIEDTWPDAELTGARPVARLGGAARNAGDDRKKDDESRHGRHGGT